MVCWAVGLFFGSRQIISELMATYTNYGIELDKRHLSILADTMTYRGTVLGITRFGTRARPRGFGRGGPCAVCVRMCRCVCVHVCRCV